MIAVLNRRPGDAGDGAEIGVSLGVVVLKRRRLKTKTKWRTICAGDDEKWIFWATEKSWKSEGWWVVAEVNSIGTTFFVGLTNVD